LENTQVGWSLRPVWEVGLRDGKPCPNASEQCCQRPAREQRVAAGREGLRWT
jgi:hypothetical protein